MILFDERDRFLLFLTVAPDSSKFARWITPGGEINSGEGILEAAQRELFEETGIRDAILRRIPGFIEHPVQWDLAAYTHERSHFFVSSVVSHSLVADNWTDDEKQDILDWKWWSLSELVEGRAATDPPGLIDLVATQLVARTPPSCELPEVPFS